MIEREFPDYFKVIGALEKVKGYINDMYEKHSELQNEINELGSSVVVISKEDFEQLQNHKEDIQ